MRASKRRKRVYSIILIPHVLRIRRDLKNYIRKERENVSIIVLTEHIGDIIASEPISYWLKKTYGHKIVWLVNKKYHDILTMFRNVDKIVDLSCLSEWVYLDKFTNFPHLYNLHFDGRECSRFHLRNKSSQKHIDFGNYYYHGCLLDFFCEVGKLPKLNIRPRLLLQQVNLSSNYLLPDKYIVVHAKSNDNERDWDTCKWNQLVSSFPGYTFIEIGLSPVLKGENCITELCGKFSFHEIAHLIKKCFFFIGIDSSIAHFSNALEKSSLILTGKFRNFETHMPYSGIFGVRDFHVIQFLGPLHELPVSMVKDEAERLISTIETK